MFGLAAGAVVGIFVAAAAVLGFGFWGIRRYLKQSSHNASTAIPRAAGLQTDSIAVVVADGSRKQSTSVAQDDTLNVALRRLSMGTEFDNGDDSRRNPLYQTVSKAGGAEVAAEVSMLNHIDEDCQ
jgi:hypothetical protein